MKILSTLRANFSNLSLKDLKKTKLTQLNDRSLLILHGSDCHKLIQGLATNDVREIKQIQVQNERYQRIAQYTLFLQAKGKIVTDAFLFQPRLYTAGKPVYSKQQLWLDVPKTAKNALKEHLKKHMWRKRVSMHDVEQGDEDYKPVIYSGYNQNVPTINALYGASIELEELQTGEDDTYANLLYYDPRGKNFGLRIVSMQPIQSIKGHFQHFPQDDHNLIFQKIGEIPHQHTINKLPFQFNYDLMNAISLKKGCFLGQEIVSRGLMAGIVRKRAFPFVLQNRSQIIENGTIIKAEDEQLGKVLFSSPGQGTAIINYVSLLEKGVAWPYKFDSPVSGTLLNPFQRQLSQYYSSMKDKQKILQDLQL